MKPRVLIALLLSLAGWTAIHGQSPTDCPGFRNPVSFNTGNSDFFWSARVGDRTYNSSNQSEVTTGNHIMSTCVTATDILGHANITSPSYNSGVDNLTAGCGYNFFDANDKRFQIIGPDNAGIDQFTVAPGGTGMPRIPPGYTRSIRLGDMMSTGSAINIQNGTPQATGNNKGAEALFYTMLVTPMNSLLFINYAVVARRYSHTAFDAGEFLIRVVKQNDNGTWPNEPINDSLWYKVSAPTFDGNEMPLGWEVGRGDVNQWPCTYAYKPWAKVAINLSQYIDQHVRIEMYTSDCIYNADPIYAYISGDFQPMRIDVSGCASDASSLIATLEAPPGLLSYQWFVTTRGYEIETYNTAHMDTVPFRPVSGVTTDNVYHPVLEDFVLSAGPNAGDTVAMQTFMCKMTSALDPNKPFTSKVYANVENGKPLPYFSMAPDCNLSASFTDYSITFGNNTVDPDSTRWVIYSDSLGTTVLDTLWGNSVNYRFPDDGYYKVTMRVKVWGKDCGSQKSQICHALQGHECPIGLSDTFFCEGETAIARCLDNCHMDKEWHIGDSVLRSDSLNSYDSIVWQPSPGITEITLTSTNGGICQTTTTAHLKTLANSALTSDADTTLICRGDTVTLSALGVDEPRWLSVPYDSALGDGNGQNIVRISPQVTTTYYAEPTHQTRCLQNASSITITVLQYPVPTIWTSHPYVDITQPTLRIEDRSPNRTSSYWTFSDGQTDQGARVEHNFNSSDDSVGITLLSCNDFCCADTSKWLPIKAPGLWIPNVFTPDQPGNNTFRLISTEDITHFEIWIYNRLGLLVYHGTDIMQGWNGTRNDGTPCPQGAYAYHYEYTLDSQPDRVISGKGTVTLLR